MLPPLPRCSRRAPNVAQTRPSVSAFPEMGVGSACTSSFSRLAQRSLTLRPAHSHGYLRDRHPGASNTSLPPCLPRLLPAGALSRVGLAPTRKRRLCTAHPRGGHSRPVFGSSTFAIRSYRRRREARRRPQPAALPAFSQRMVEREHQRLPKTPINEVSGRSRSLTERGSIVSAPLEHHGRGASRTCDHIRA